MKAELNRIARRQLPSGEFPTTVRHDPSGLERFAHTRTPTYLICMMLMQMRESGYADPVVDQIVERGLDFLERSVYFDPVEGWRVVHFNAFYAPDWEETCWVLTLLFEAGRITQRELEPMRRLLVANETPDKGVGVWVKDPYTPGNATPNAFDPVVSLAVCEMLQRVFQDQSQSTETFLVSAIESGTPSLYYRHEFQQFFYWFTGRDETLPQLKHDRWQLFHNARRHKLVYASKEVWRTAEILLAS